LAGRNVYGLNSGSSKNQCIKSLMISRYFCVYISDVVLHRTKPNLKPFISARKATNIIPTSSLE